MVERLDDFERLQHGRLHNPFAVVGRHALKEGFVIRAFMPTAVEVELKEFGPMRRVDGYDIYEAFLDADDAERVGQHYRLRWRETRGGPWHEVVDPYSFGARLYEDDLHLFSEGRHHHAYRFLGARHELVDGVSGCLFAVWAPGVERVSVVGSFNGWNGLRHPMRSRGGSGVWELFIPGVCEADLYKFEVRNIRGHVFTKADPYARSMGLRPDTDCRVPAASNFAWGDESWMRSRASFDWQHQPVSIYELHLGSWRRGSGNTFLDYDEIARQLIPYVKDLGFTHIELLPVMEHPLDESWGYQVSGYYAPTARFGEPDALRRFVDACHRNQIGVILDWVPGHFPKDDFALARFTGDPVYEHPDPRRGEHRDWGTLIFDYGRNEVRNFLLSNAVYWCEEFHVDGLRVDAVASMLYLDYSRADGDWVPNEHGGRENLEAIAFLREVNRVLHARFPGVLSIAEESTAWPMVSRPIEAGGLGFTMKWNMGWMNDTLAYFALDPIYRRFHHDKLTFGQMYAYSENFVLPLSHDEVVHMKGSLLGKMPGDEWQRLAGLRLLLAWQFATPGKKLLFMGGEFGQEVEWSESRSLDWHLLDDDRHAGLQRLVGDLNRFYGESSPLHRLDFEPRGFTWLDADNAERSVLAFMRRDETGEVICAFNMTPLVREGYRIGLPGPGKYRERANTDSAMYGGSNCGNLGGISSEPQPCMGQPYSAELVLPPLAAVFFERESGA